MLFARAMSILMSSMIGKPISTPNFSLVICVQASCSYRRSIDRPSSPQFMLREVLACFESR